MFITFNVVYPIIFSPVYFLNVKLPARYIAIFCVSSNMFNDEWDDDRVSKPTYVLHIYSACMYSVCSGSESQRNEFYWVQREIMYLLSSFFFLSPNPFLI